MKVVWIAVMSMFGALARYGVSFLVTDDVLTPVLTVNLIGSFLMGLLTVIFKYHSINDNVSKGITTGFLGSFTTFSALSMETVHMFQHGNWLNLSIYLIVTIIGGLFVCWIGMMTGEVMK